MDGRGRFAASINACVAAALVLLLGASAQPAANGRFGGTLVVGLNRSFTDTLDPTTEAQFGSVVILRAIAERLYDFDTKGREYPELASAMPTPRSSSCSRIARSSSSGTGSSTRPSRRA